MIAELPLPASVALAGLSLSLGTCATEFVAASRMTPVLKKCYKTRVIKPSLQNQILVISLPVNGGFCNGKNTVGFA